MNMYFLISGVAIVLGLYLYFYRDTDETKQTHYPYRSWGIALMIAGVAFCIGVYYFPQTFKAIMPAAIFMTEYKSSEDFYKDNLKPVISRDKLVVCNDLIHGGEYILKNRTGDQLTKTWWKCKN